MFKWKYKLKRCSNKECCKQCRYVMFKGTMTKWPVQKLTQGTTQNSYNIMTQQTFRKDLFLCFSDFSFFKKSTTCSVILVNLFQPNHKRNRNSILILKHVCLYKSCIIKPIWSQVTSFCLTWFTRN